MSASAPRILYCHCQYAQVVPKEVKEAVLSRLCEAGVAFEAVADLCESAARKDTGLRRLAGDGEEPIKIAACFPRAVKWLFHQGGAALSVEKTEVLNMRVQKPDEIVAALLDREMRPNLPAGKITAPARTELAEQTVAAVAPEAQSSSNSQPAVA